MLKLTTDRLLLIPCSLHIAKAMILDPAYLQIFLRMKVPAGWPADELKAYLPYYIEQIEGDPSLLGWGVWILLDSERKTVIGDAGFKGKPDENGEIEIGYSVHPDYRRRGYAFEAAQALTDWGFRDGSGVQLIRAECNIENLSSVRVLEKLGMQRVGNIDSVLKWELHSVNSGEM